MAVRIPRALQEEIDRRRQARTQEEEIEAQNDPTAGGTGAPSAIFDHPTATRESTRSRGTTSSTSGGGGGGGSGGGSGSGGGEDDGGDAAAEEEEIETLSILSSPTARWLRDTDTGLWYIEYQLPGGGGKVLFEAEDEQVKAIFGQAEPPEFQKFDFDRTVRGQGTHFAGNVGEVEGEGSFEDEVERVITLALDQRNMPDWIQNDPKALDSLWVMVTEDRTDDWFYEQISSLQSFKERYPAVAELESRGMSISEAVQAHTQFETKLKTLHAAAGFAPEAVSHELVGNLITKGYSINQVGESYKVWKRMRDHAPAMQAFNQILEANGMQPIKGNKMYEFLSGNAPAEVYELYEGSAIQEAATASGLGDLFEAEDALGLAIATEQNLTRDQAFERFSGVASQALRFRHQLNLEQYELSFDDLVDVAFGQAPRSGKSSAEVGEILARISQQAEGFLKERPAPFFGFSDTGVPQARSFGELRRESV